MPPLEAWEKVLINLGSAVSTGELDLHLSQIACWDCHGGDPGTDDMESAHAGLIADPSGPDTAVCGTCHTEIQDSYSGSLHFNVWGMKEMVAKRLDQPSFGSCPAEVKDGFGKECSKCHATCGDCHISRPNPSGKGFIDSHVFKAKPHQKNQCMACHGARIGADFMGNDEEGRLPDAHFAKGKSCTSCHGANQLHASVPEDRDRYHNDSGASCESCHDIPNVNNHHIVHWDDLSCHVCHSQPYSNCGSCHVEEAWKTDPDYQENNPSIDFRIGLNPIPDRRFKYVTLRHAPVAPDTYDNWGEKGMATKYNDYPSWKYTTPHSIRRWTERTSVPEGAGCGANCHLGSPGGSMDNINIYLFKEYVESNWPDEVEANSEVIIDGELPSNWWQE